MGMMGLFIKSQSRISRSRRRNKPRRERRKTSQTAPSLHSIVIKWSRNQRVVTVPWKSSFHVSERSKTVVLFDKTMPFCGLCGVHRLIKFFWKEEEEEEEWGNGEEQSGFWGRVERREVVIKRGLVKKDLMCARERERERKENEMKQWQKGV